MAQEISAPVIVKSSTPIVQAAPERVYSATEYEAVKKEAVRWQSEFDALLLLHQQQITVIFQVALSQDLESVKDLIRQIQIAGMLGEGKQP
jgi:hypothetical protein